MKKKWWFLIVVGFILAAGLAIAIPALLPPTPGVTYANFSRLEKGMTQEQVEQLLGKPNANDMERIDWMLLFRAPVVDEQGTWWSWQSDAGDFASVHFDEPGTLKSATWNGWTDDRVAWEKLRDRLPWMSRKRTPGKININ